VLRGMRRASSVEADAWEMWERWISEIVADFWSVARLGLASTMGLMSVVSLPRPFIFRVNRDDPHPMPWIRVKVSAAFGRALFPQPAWDELGQLWEAYYPREGLHPEQRRLIELLERTIPGLVAVIVNHRPPPLRGRTLPEVLDLGELQPGRLRALMSRWRAAPEEMYGVRPIVAFAAIGQGRAEGQISPEEESAVMGKLLSHWALQSTLDAAAGCSREPAQECFCRGSLN